MDEAQRIEKFNEITRMEWAKPKSKAKVRETPYSWIVSQDMEHPRVKNMNRQVEIFKEVPRAKVNIFFDRISSIAPEVFYAKFPFPQDCRHRNIIRISHISELLNRLFPFTVCQIKLKIHFTGRIYTEVNYP